MYTICILDVCIHLGCILYRNSKKRKSIVADKHRLVTNLNRRCFRNITVTVFWKGCLLFLYSMSFVYKRGA